MLQRFPVESKGRRKKLQEVKHQFYKSIKSLLFSASRLFTHFVSLYMVGWLRDNDMLYLFPNQMHYGKDTNKHILIFLVGLSSLL